MKEDIHAYIRSVVTKIKLTLFSALVFVLGKFRLEK
jgi:hypothetical protein